jgi:hypothetical protein
MWPGSGEGLDGALSPQFDAQVRQALINLKIALASKGASLQDVFKLTLLVVDHSETRLQQGGRSCPRLGWQHDPDLHLDPGTAAGAGRHAGGNRCGGGGDLEPRSRVGAAIGARWPQDCVWGRLPAIRGPSRTRPLAARPSVQLPAWR